MIYLKDLITSSKPIKPHLLYVTQKVLINQLGDWYSDTIKSVPSCEGVQVVGLVNRGTILANISRIYLDTSKLRTELLLKNINIEE